MKSKAQMMWEVGKEQEEFFINEYLPNDIQVIKEFLELIKLIRGSEYRRGKEDGIKEYKKELLE